MTNYVVELIIDNCIYILKHWWVFLLLSINLYVCALFVKGAFMSLKNIDKDLNKGGK